MIRQPIIVVMGHVDHGKTTLLDKIRKTAVAKSEAGAITQCISASIIPVDAIRKISEPVSGLLKAEITIPGLLFIDTPGHEAFTNLRSRGGSIADLAILVIDIMQGIQPQTVESIGILKEYKTPFVIAANKIDLISGWKSKKDQSFLKSFESQLEYVRNEVENKIYAIIGELSKYGFNGERFDRVRNFTKEISIMTVSAKTGEGIPELLLFLSGISQKYLEKELKTEIGPGKGGILEVKYEKGLGTTIDTILYDGEMKKGDIIVFGTKSGASSTKVRGLIEPREGKFEYLDSVSAACGVKIFAPGLEDALAGSQVFVARNEEEEKNLKNQITSEIRNILISTEKDGVILRADTLGSLEAITKMLTSEKIAIRKADVGDVVKTDLVEAISVRGSDRYSGAILAFNVNVPYEIADEAGSKEVPVISSNIIYTLIDRFKEWKEAEKERERKEAFTSLVLPGKIKVLPGCCFRISKPAIFGIEVQVGYIKPDYQLMNQDGKIMGTIKTIQLEKETIKEATEKQQVAISMDEPIFGRHVNERDVLYTVVPRKDYLLLIDKYKSHLTSDELDLLERIMKVKIR